MTDFVKLLFATPWGWFVLAHLLSGFTGACALEDSPDTDVVEPEPPSGEEVCGAWCEAGGARYASTESIYGGLRCKCDLVVMDMVAMTTPELPAEAPPKED